MQQWKTSRKIISQLWLKLQVRLLSNLFLFFIDLGSTHSYINPRVVEDCDFKKLKHNKSWLVQLATGTKKKVSKVVRKCPLVMNGRSLMNI